MSAPTEAVRLGPARWPQEAAYLREARSAAGSPERRLAFAADWGRRLPRPGLGSTRARWEMLATAGAVDLSLARTLEPHADALAVLAEAGLPTPPESTTWGVYAAEGGGRRLTARAPADGDRSDRWRLDGDKPWCSLAGRLSHALVTAWDEEQRRRLFAVDLRGPGVQVVEGGWVSRGLVEIPSTPVSFADVPAEPVGGQRWYLERDGFAWGGLGVAAVWYGATVALARRLRDSLTAREPDQIALAHLGAVDRAVVTARSVLAGAAAAVDAGHATGPEGELLALRARGIVADAAERVLGRVDHALGPAPLTQEEEHARRVADLRVYLRQHHAERDDAAQGRAVLSRTPLDPGAAGPGSAW